MSEAYEALVVPSEIAFLLYNINARARKIQELYDENLKDTAKIAQIEKEQKTKKGEKHDKRNNRKSNGRCGDGAAGLGAETERGVGQ